jgi:hypothetical protein
VLNAYLGQFAVVFLLGIGGAALWFKRSLNNKDTEIGIWKAKAQTIPGALVPDEAAKRIEVLESQIKAILGSGREPPHKKGSDFAGPDR